MGFGDAMNDSKINEGAALIAIAAMASATGAVAQTTPAPETPRTIPGLVIAPSTPQPGATPVPVPSAPVRGLPATASVARAMPRPVATPRPVRRSEPGPAPTSAPIVRPTADATPTLAPVETPTATPAAQPTAVSSPSPIPTPAAALAASPGPDGGHGVWPWVAAVLVLLLALLGWRWSRRARPAPDAVERRPARPAPHPAPPPPPAVAEPCARIAVAYRPTRAGLNMLSAIVDGEAIVTNTGDATAHQVRVHATLLSAHAGQDANIAAAFATPASRPAAPPFALAPGEQRRIRTVAALPREAVRSMDAGGRPMFVPMVAVDVRYLVDEAGAAARTGQAFVIGVERVDSAKLAPLWLDAPMRMYDQVAARAQGAEVID